MRTRWLGAPLGVLVFFACSGEKSKHPPALGDCLNAQEGCTTPPVGAGGQGDSPPDASHEEASSTGPTTSCGTAGSLILTQNPACGPCIVMSCCMADMLCTASCQSILQCVQGCPPGDTTCVFNCESDPLGSMSYGDFQSCVVGNCPACPALQR